MKKNKYKILTIFVVALFILVPGIVFAAKIVESSKVSYDNSKTGLPNNVQGAIDTLYTRQNTETNYWKEKYYDTVLKNLNNAPLVDFIRGRLKTDGKTIIQDDGTAGHNMRYIGANPNNWISFNGEKWRIIGIFGEDSHGQSDELIKIQYSGNVGRRVLDENGTNDWSKATLQTYLNEGDYYTNTLKSDAKQLIQKVDWKLGGSTWLEENFIAGNLYKLERGSIGGLSNPTLTKWNGNVAFAYMSDYLFSTNGGATYNRTECLNSPGRSFGGPNKYWSTDEETAGECVTSSWMIQQVRDNATSHYSLSLRSNTINILVVSNNYTDGVILTSSTIANITPSVYLKSNVICTNCSESTAGTEGNPFKIKLG